MWDKADLWILEEAMAIYSGKVIISAYLCSGKDSYLFRKQSNGIYGLSHVYNHKEMLFKNYLYFKVKSQKMRLLRILMMLIRFLSSRIGSLKKWLL